MNKKVYALICMVTLLNGLTAAGKKDNDSSNSNATHVELAPDEGIYKGVVVDNGTSTMVTKISFAGDTVIDGIKKERDNSSNRVSLADIVSMQILDANHKSRRYKKQEFTRIMVTTTTGAQEELLFPRSLLICAQSQHSGIKKSWFLKDLDGLSIRHGLQDPVTSVPAHQMPALTPHDDHAHHAPLIPAIGG